MQPSIFRSLNALTAIGSQTSVNQVSNLTARARWICTDCRSRLQPRHQSKDRDVLITLSSAQSRPLLHKSSLKGLSLDQRRRLQSSHTRETESKIREDLPSLQEGRRSNVAKRFSHIMDHMQSNIFIAGQRLNDLTGYSGIEALKKDIENQEELVQFTRKALQAAREAYSTAISQRSSSQRKVNELLQRKHNWSPQDLEQFTALYRSDHANEQAESTAQENLVKMERKAEEAAATLSASILARYHEEQIWSDKIRRMSTWGTWGLMGVNVLLFLVFQIGVEPWRRKRLVKGFEDKVMEALERESTATPHVVAESHKEQISKKALSEPIPEFEESCNQQSSKADTILLMNESKPSENVVAKLEPEIAIHQDAKPSPSRFGNAGVAIQDLFSHREIVLRMIDVTILALEGAAAGIFVAGAVFVFVSRPR